MTFSMASKEFQTNPYQLYLRLREHDPVMAMDYRFIGQTFFVTRYDDVVTVLKDPRFSNEQRKLSGARDWSKNPLIPGIVRSFANTMVMVDEPDHARLKNLVHKGFTPRMIQQMATRIDEISHSLLDQAAKKQPADLIADFALPLPLIIISEMMGVPLKERDRFNRLIKSFLKATSSPSTLTMLAQFPNTFALDRFFRDLITLRRSDPQNDLITALVQAEEQGDKLSEDELVAMLLLLLLAGHETTVNLLGNGTLALMEHPDQLNALTSDLSLLDSAIEEILRFTGPVQHVAQRYALEDVDLSGHRIPKGSTVIVGIASANRDEAVFKNADQFNVTRSPNRHIAFGMGIHYCLGAPLARLEAKIAFTVLLTRFPRLKLAVPSDQLVWQGAPSMRGLESLPLYLLP